MLQTLEQIGIPKDQRDAIRRNYNGNLDDLAMYVLVCMAMFDDRHEYLA